MKSKKMVILKKILTAEMRFGISGMYVEAL